MTKLDDLTAWRYLIAFSKTGTFLAAANLLEVDVSNISRGITALERALGCDLIRRNSRPMELSETGRIGQTHDADFAGARLAHAENH